MNMARRPRKLPVVLTRLELEAFMSSFNTKDEIGFRNSLIVRLMSDCGLRIAEVLNVRVADLNVSDGKLLVKEGKGKVDRYVYIGQGDCDLLQRWIDEKSISSDFLFTTKTGGHIHPSYFRGTWNPTACGGGHVLMALP